jgi:hypothetical protein
MVSIPFIFYIIFSIVTGLLEVAWVPISILLGLGTVLGILVGTNILESGLTGESRTAAFIAATLSPLQFGLSAMVFAALPGTGFPADFSGVLVIFFNALYGFGILYIALAGGSD